MNLSITWRNFSPFKTSTSPFPSLFNKCSKRINFFCSQHNYQRGNPPCAKHLFLDEVFNLLNNFLKVTFDHQVIMCTSMNCYSNQIFLFVHNIIHANCTHIHIEGDVITNFTKKWTRNKTISFKVMNKIATPSCFVFTFVKKKEITSIISTLQMAQASSCLKSKFEIVFDVSCVDLASHLAIMFLVHSLHPPKMTVETKNGGEFKKKITIKCGQNATSILNVKLIIIQISQFRNSVHDKQHCLETVCYTQHIWYSHRRNVYNGIFEISKNRSKMTNVQRLFRWAKRVWRHSILIGKITQIYEQRLKINMVGENSLLELHKM